MLHIKRCENYKMLTKQPIISSYYSYNNYSTSAGGGVNNSNKVFTTTSTTFTKIDLSKLNDTTTTTTTTMGQTENTTSTQQNNNNNKKVNNSNTTQKNMTFNFKFNQTSNYKVPDLKKPSVPFNINNHLNNNNNGNGNNNNNGTTSTTTTSTTTSQIHPSGVTPNSNISNPFSILGMNNNINTNSNNSFNKQSPTPTKAHPFMDYLKANTSTPNISTNNNNNNNNQKNIMSNLGFSNLNQTNNNVNNNNNLKKPSFSFIHPTTTTTTTTNTANTDKPILSQQQSQPQSQPQQIIDPMIPRFGSSINFQNKLSNSAINDMINKDGKEKEAKEKEREQIIQTYNNRQKEKEKKVEMKEQLQREQYNYQPLFKTIERVNPMMENESSSRGNKRKIIKPIVVPSMVTVENLAPMIGQSMVELIKWLIKAGLKPSSRYQPIEDDILMLLGQDYLFSPMRIQDDDVILEKTEKEAKEKVDPTWPTRPPVVTIVGHIDHGKTSLLDYLRKTSVVDKEAGRITQHIGAFEVKIKTGPKPADHRMITFMDTPGHSAFSTMRERGVGITDIALLIVAGDDGVQEQTIEAIRVIKKAPGVQIVVAINKMDKPGVDVEAVKMELLEQGIACEGVGGDIPCVEISAKTGMGIDKLEETILFLADIMELKAPITNTQTSGVVIESTFKKNRGTYSSILVKKGIIKTGQWFVVGESYGKVKEMRNHLEQSIKEGKPGQPVEIFGFKEGVPNPGDQLFIFNTEKEVMDIIEARKEKKISQDTSSQIKKLAYGEQDEEEIDEQEEGENKDTENNTVDGVEKKIIKFFVKGDVTGSAEALTSMLDSLPEDPEISSEIKKVGYGEVTETDLKDASMMKTPIIYFGSKLNSKIIDSGKRQGITIIQSDVIYHVVNHVKNYLETCLDPITVYNVVGQAKVNKVFAINSSKDKVAGCKIEDGKFKKGSKIQILRDGQSIHEGRIDIIKLFKEVVKEVEKGQECGITIREFNEIQPDDQILTFNQTQEQRKLGEFIKFKYNYK